MDGTESVGARRTFSPNVSWIDCAGSTENDGVPLDCGRRVSIVTVSGEDGAEAVFAGSVWVAVTRCVPSAIVAAAPDVVTSNVAVEPVEAVAVAARAASMKSEMAAPGIVLGTVKRTSRPGAGLLGFVRLSPGSQPVSEALSRSGV